MPLATIWRGSASAAASGDPRMHGAGAGRRQQLACPGMSSLRERDADSWSRNATAGASGPVDGQGIRVEAVSRCSRQVLGSCRCSRKYLLAFLLPRELIGQGGFCHQQGHGCGTPGEVHDLQRGAAGGDDKWPCQRLQTAIAKLDAATIPVQPGLRPGQGACG